MKFGKRQIVMAGLVLALGAAVYLNWQFSDNTQLLSPANSVSTSKELGQAQFVNNSADSGAEEAGENEDVQVNAKMSTKAEEYFAQAKTDRKKSQDEITDMAQTVLESAQENENAKIEAVAKAAELATLIEQQLNIESLIKAKGFAECMVFIQNKECSIVVADEDLTEDDVLIIKDVASGQSGIDFEKIKITAV